MTETKDPPQEMPTLTPYVSETSRYPGLRALVQPFCEGYGLDIGFGGDAINTTVVRMDLPRPYVNTGEQPVQLGGDCRDLRWFSAEALDYVYSSHVLEDFAEHETEAVLHEWTRVLRVGGHLCLLLPDQVQYVRHCRAQGERPNDHHSIPHFSLAYVKQVAARLGNLTPALEQTDIGPYSFLAVFQKSAASDAEGSSHQDLHDKLQQSWAECDQQRVQLHRQEQQIERLQRRESELTAQWEVLQRHPALRAWGKVRRLRDLFLRPSPRA